MRQQVSDVGQRPERDHGTCEELLVNRHAKGVRGRDSLPPRWCRHLDSDTMHFVEFGVRLRWLLEQVQGVDHGPACTVPDCQKFQEDSEEEVSAGC